VWIYGLFLLGFLFGLFGLYCGIQRPQWIWSLLEKNIAVRRDGSTFWSLDASFVFFALPLCFSWRSGDRSFALKGGLS